MDYDFIEILGDDILYIVERMGIHPQGIFGVFDRLDLALRLAEKVKAKEKDNYHSFYVTAVRLNEILQFKDSECITVFEGTC